MSIQGAEFPECCRYCPHRSSVSGACDHVARQDLVRRFTQQSENAETCPIFADWRANAMTQLSQRLTADTDRQSGE